MAAIASPAPDITTSNGRDNLTAVAARSVPLTRPYPLPTPPNSISPSIPPHGLRAYDTRAAAAATVGAINLEIDSDLDLHDEIWQDKLDNRHIGSSGLDTAGAITSSLLAKHYLPHILLTHGPLAIRHITGYLTTSVPGFSGIPPAKARRLVVGALEGRGVGDAGGMRGEVKFEKVGWGCWSAKDICPVRGYSPPPSGPNSYTLGLPIARTPAWTFDRPRLNAPSSSWAGNSATFSHDDHVDTSMLEDEADNMSMDGDGSDSSSEAQDEEIMGDDPEDLTDDEDWAAVGAAALRATSGLATSCLHPSTSRVYSRGSHGGGGPSLLTKKHPSPHDPFNQPLNDHDPKSLDTASNFQEREAVEALLRLGSV